MQIQSGKLYENRTWRYLYPCLKSYGEDLTKGLANFFKVAVGVGDANRDEKFDCIYILLDTNLALPTDKQRQEYRSKFQTFMDWISYKDYYVADYVYQKDLHMLVLKIPEKHLDTFAEFVRGNYSVMYNISEIRNYFRYVSLSNRDMEVKQNDKLRATRKILQRDKSYVPTFVDIVNKRFNTTVGKEFFQDTDLDFGPVKKEEIFNYKEEEA